MNVFTSSTPIYLEINPRATERVMGESIENGGRPAYKIHRYALNDWSEMSNMQLAPQPLRSPFWPQFQAAPIDVFVDLSMDGASSSSTLDGYI